MEQQPIKVALAGLGTISATHRAAIEHLNATLVGVCDPQPQTWEGYTVPAYEDFQQLLTQSQAELIHICTPHYLHVPMTMEALSADKFVLLEKPAATRAVDLEQLINHPNSHRLAICLQHRYDETVCRAKALLEQGHLGKITGMLAIVPWYRDDAYYQNSPWRGKLATEGGCLLVNQAIHTLDLMCVLGGPMVRVKGHVDNYTHQDSIQGEDTATAAITFANGATGMLFATNSFEGGAGVQLAINCEKGTLRLTENTLYVNGEPVCENKKAAAGKSYYGGAHQTLIGAFYEYAQGLGGSRVAPEEVMAVTKLIEGIYQSSAQNSSCQL